MAWLEDLSVCTYFPIKDSSNLRAVGWLERDKPYRIGDVDAAAFKRLCELTRDPWSPVASGGVHRCSLCRFTGDSVGHYQVEPHGQLCVSAVGSAVSLFVPGNGVIYVSPTSITHYIDAHGYGPPEEFCEAVLRCPPMKSTEYLKAILANGGRGLKQ